MMRRDQRKLYFNLHKYCDRQSSTFVRIIYIHINKI